MSPAGPSAAVSLADMARAAGRAGEDWEAWTFSEAVQEVFNADMTVDLKPVEAAYADGRREHRIVGGWRIAWTTAPEDYDTFGTETIEACGEWKGRQLRKVMAHPHHANYQFDRYGSGAHGTFDEDPRETDRKIQERIAREKAEDEARAAKRAQGLAWLAALGDTELEENSDPDQALRGISYQDVREEQQRRAKAKADAAQAAEWECCRALVPDGAILLDEGTEYTPAVSKYQRGFPGKPTHVHYRIRLTNDWAKDAEKADVTDEGGGHAGSLALVAHWIEIGRFRVVGETEVPPRPVVDRIGHERLKEIKRIEAEGRTVWVGESASFGPRLVLDEKGRIVRARKVLAEALEKAGPRW